MNTEFTCEVCKLTFPNVRSNEEALKEKDILFPELPDKDLAIACEDCFIRVMDFNEPGLKRYKPFIDIENIKIDEQKVSDFELLIKELYQQTIEINNKFWNEAELDERLTEDKE